MLDESLLVGVTLPIQWVNPMIRSAIEMDPLAVAPAFLKIVSFLWCKFYGKYSKAL